MNKTIYAASMPLAVLGNAFLLVSNSEAATTRTVCATGCQYSTIQSAIDAAAAGDTISIGKGHYVELLNTAGKRLTLQGADWRTTIIDANGQGAVLTIPGSAPVIVTDVTLTRGFGDGGGISVFDSF